MMPDQKKILDEMAARCEAATKGPWEWQMNDLDELRGPNNELLAVEPFDHTEESGFWPVSCSCQANKDFMAHARTDLPRAIAALRIYDEAARDAIAEADALGAVATNVWAEMVETSAGLMTARGKATAALTGEEATDA